METLNRLYLTDLITASHGHTHTRLEKASESTPPLAGSLAATAHPAPPRPRSPAHHLLPLRRRLVLLVDPMTS